MKLLFIGGNRFVGWHMVDAALVRGHQVTLFNRGLGGVAPAGAEQRTGDRSVSLDALAEGSWDAVIDCCGYLPGEVARMADALRGRVGRYGFISSVSAYASAATPNREDSPLGAIDDVDTEVVDARTYGPLKALCEAALRRRFGAEALLLRPGLVVGPRDPTQRFTYWPARLARAVPGETVLAPGRPEAPVQFIDARDLAAFALDAIEHGLCGAFNVASPADALTMGALLDACAAAAGVVVRFVRADVAVLRAQGLVPWKDLPLVLPADDAELRAMMRCDTARAIAAGLACRPLAQTIADTLGWWRSLPAAEQAFTRAGLSPEREAAALTALSL